MGILTRWLWSLGLAAGLGCVSAGEHEPPAQRVKRATAPSGFGVVDVFTGLEAPTAVRFASDGRVFVAEKSGLIKVFASLSATTHTVFADLRTATHDAWDRGLLGLELHPSFPSVPYVYALYAHDAAIGGTAPRWGDTCPTPPGPTDNGCVASGRLSRLTASGNVSVAETVLLENWCQQFMSHSVGDLAFGPDGQLYVSGGDGADFINIDYGQRSNPCGDPPLPATTARNPATSRGGAFRAQSLDPTATGAVPYGGKILRVDPITGAASAGNPLTGAGRDRVVALGMRNPFRFTFRPRTSELWVGDVGFDTWEEINRFTAPAVGVANFGWPCYEGAAGQEGYQALGSSICATLAAAPASVTAPFFAYSHAQNVVAGDGCAPGSSSISGLAFYDAATWPAQWRDALFFADYARGCIWSMRAGANGAPDPATRAVFVGAAGAPVDLVAGPGGDLFYVDIANGSLRRVVYFGANEPPVARFTATPASGPAPLAVTFNASTSTDPNPNEILQYQWDLDQDGAYDDGVGVTAARTFTQTGSYAVRLRVVDSGGLASGATQTVNVGVGPPVPRITAPLATAVWSVNTSVTFRGTATDPSLATVPASAFAWSLVMHHCPSNCHEHVIRTWTGVTTGSFTAPDHEYPCFLELRLTVTSPATGLVGQASVALQPRTAAMTLDAVPPGMPLSMFAAVAPTPFTRSLIDNGAVTITAPSPQVLNGTSYYFNFWSDGGAATHAVRNVRGAVTRTATYGVTAPGTLPAPWLRRDFGYVQTAGRTTALAADSFMLRSLGTIAVEDAFNFTYRTLSGNGEVVARVTRLDPVDPLARAAVMIRNDTFGMARYAATVLTAQGDVRFQRRTADDAAFASTTLAGRAVPSYIRVVRSGTSFTSYVSADGAAWTQVGTAVTIPMNTSVLVGLAAAAEHATIPTYAVFDRVQVIPR